MTRVTAAPRPPRNINYMSHAAIALSAVTAFRTLDAFLKWALRQRSRFTPEDVVIQDEYTHDVGFRAPDGSVLVFDTT